MRSRKLRWVLVLAGLAVVSVAAVILWPPPGRITPEVAKRIKEGMTIADVEAILGPAGDYSTRPNADPVKTYWAYTDDFDEARWNSIRNSQGIAVYEWTSNEFIVAVYCRSGRVAGVDCFSYDTVEQTMLENLLWRAKRQWHRWFP